MNMKPQNLAAALVSVQTALDNCTKSKNLEWHDRWCQRLIGLLALIPHGAGIDSGPDHPEVSAVAIRFTVGFHHMNENGMYDGWTHHGITVRPSFDGIDVRVGGRDRRNIKDYLHEVMHHAFSQHVWWDEPAQRWVMESNIKPRWTRSATSLALVAHDDEFTLVQTPTSVTDRALWYEGNTGAAIAIYERWLRDSRMWDCVHDDSMCWACWNGYAPGWSWDPITRHVAMINAFVAFAPGARFGRT